MIDLLAAEAPQTCLNFLKLCKLKYYNFSPLYNIQPGFSFQTGDPLYPDGDGGSSIWGLLPVSPYAEDFDKPEEVDESIAARFHLTTKTPSKKYFPAGISKVLKHKEIGTVSMATTTVVKRRDLSGGQDESAPEKRLAGSQFLITLGSDLEYLDDKAAIFGQVVEGLDTLKKINDAVCDDSGRPLKDIRIRHTYVLEDPYEDMEGLIEPPKSPNPSKEQLKTVRMREDEIIEEELDQEKVDKKKREREARANALALEIMGDLPFAEVKPPENILFVCKLNAITQGGSHNSISLLYLLMIIR